MNTTKSIVDENKETKKKSFSILDFIFPKMCDDYIHATKSAISINYQELASKSNIVGTDFYN